jgi:hypothetical protein
MSSFPADGAMEAICFFEPRNGSVFRHGPAAERLSSLPVFRHVTCGFDASNAAGRFSTPVRPEQKIDDAGGRSASDVVRRVGLGGLAGHSRHAPGRPGSHDASGGGSTVLMRWDYPPCALRARAQGYGNQSMIGTSSRCRHMRGRGRTCQRVNPGLQSVLDPTSANRGARPAAR